MLAPLTPGFMVLQGNQLEDLREVVVQWLAEHPLAPLEHECFLVQSNGIAQWLKIALASNAHGKGIAAAIDVQLPGRFIWQAYRSVFPELPTRSAFDKGPLTWRLYHLLHHWSALCDQLGEQASLLAPLQGFLSADEDPRRCYQLAARLADLYDQYQLYRADWLQAWEQGRKVIIKANGSEQPLPPEQQWQALLWQLLNKSIEQSVEPSLEPESERTHLGKLSRARIHQAFIARCRDFSPRHRPAELPRRVIVFSISSLPTQTLELLQALSPFTQVMVFVTNPSEHYWGDLVEGKELLRREYRRIRERMTPANIEAEALHAYGHPLLASWGKQGRDFLHLLDEHDQPEHYRHYFNRQKIDLFSPPPGNGLLQQLQADILHLRSLEERRALASAIDPAHDRSLQFLIAHSPQREVEILHDQLLDSFEHAKAEGKTLHPRDILVMVPDINLYSPHIHAVFGRYAQPPHFATADDRAADGSSASRDGRYLPYHISDQSQRRQNTLLIALESLLQLPQARFNVSQLSDLLDVPALRERFGLAENDLPILRRWIKGANIRWGLDAEQRAELGLPSIEQNSWLFGLQRMLLGYAAGEYSSWQGIEAYDEVSGLEAALLGPLSRLIDRLRQARQQMMQAHTSTEWLTLIGQLLPMFFTETSAADRWALDRLQIQLEQLQEIWQSAGLEHEELPLEVVREELLAGLDETNLSQKFLGGSINFATLMPMRAIPFQQLWLLGMNDRDYPRQSQHADFDLMADDYRPGDRSRREDDRYLFLEALLSARQRLVISWVGRDIRDHSEKPPSVLVSQLRDHIQAGWSLAGAGPDAPKDALLSALSTQHPLQAFSRRYFESTRDPRLFTYAREWRALHDSPVDEHRDELPAWQAEAPLSLEDLVSFLRNPVDYFYRRRLGIRWYDEHLDIADSEPFHPDALEAWNLRDSLVSRIRSALYPSENQNKGQNSDQLLQQEIARLQRSGELPMPPFGPLLQSQLEQALQAPLQHFQQLLIEYPQQLAPRALQLELELELEGSLILQDSLNDIRCNHAGEHVRLLIHPGTLHEGKSKKYHQLLRHWPAHLAAQLHQPTCTRILGPDTDLSLPPLSADQASELLRTIMASLYAGMQRPLPLACKTAFAALEASGKPQEHYEGDPPRSSGEVSATPGLQKLWPDYARLSAEADFLRLAEQLYRPLMHALGQQTTAEVSA